MTRWARGFKKKHVDASSWDELRKKVYKDEKSEEQDSGSKRIGRKGDLKKEKQREARRNRRKMKKVCFNCRKPGHSIAECPSSKDEDASTGICFKCGSTEHAVKDCKAKVAKDVFPFAKCFICGQNGHISKNCPDNPRGLYPLGGGCAFCQSVEHYKRDCPENPGNKRAADKGKSKGIGKRQKNDFSSIDAETFTDEESEEDFQESKLKKKPKVVKF